MFRLGDTADAEPCTSLDLKPLDKCIAKNDPAPGWEDEQGHRLRGGWYSIIRVVFRG